MHCSARAADGIYDFLAVATQAQLAGAARAAPYSQTLFQFLLRSRIRFHAVLTVFLLYVPYNKRDTVTVRATVKTV